MPIPRILTAVFLLLACALRANAEDLPLDIQVRSDVDRPFKGLGREKAKEHGKLYAVAYIKETPGTVDLARPVDEVVLLKHLRTELTKRGFREAATEEQPEIILTVHYGRGFLRNPYLDDVNIDETSNPPVLTYVGLPTSLMRQKTHRFEEKLQAAQFEKLFIRVTAWDNPSKQPEPKAGKKQKPKQLWKTTMITDDPAHRDLNQFVEKLLAAGSEFFDREIKSEEAFIRTDLPEGYVKIGDAKVVSDDADKEESPPKTK